MNSSQIPLLVIAVLGLLGGLFFIWTGFVLRNQANRVAASGVDAEAEVIERRIVGTTRNRSRYVKYRFDVVRPDGGRLTYTHEQSVSRENYNSLPEGSKATIRYLPDEPERTARLAGVFADNTDFTNGLAYGSGCLIGAVLGLGVILSSAAQATSKADATARQISTASADFPAVRAVLDPLLPAWKATTDKDNHRVSPSSVGLASSSLTEIDYGYCQDNFYVYAVKELKPGKSGVRVGDAYAYTSKSQRCWPSDWIVASKGDLGGGWRLVGIAIIEATSTVPPQ